ncbi:MAG: excinuclease ABC subunit UvrA [Bacteroidota bacterium]
MKRDHIEVQGARVHNLKNISVKIPREKLIVITGLSGSGKSSLAFDTIYAEGQRRYMESLSTYAKRFIAQINKPDVDFVYGLSPVISIEQKTIQRNPRSTIATMTDIGSYLNLLYATIAVAHDPWEDRTIPIKSPAIILDALMGLEAGTLVELRAPIYPVYGEDFAFLVTEIRKKGYRKLYVNGRLFDLQEEFDIDETQENLLEVLIDQFEIQPDRDKEILTSIQNAILVGDPYLRIHLPKKKKDAKRLYDKLECGPEGMLSSEPNPNFFMFNEPASACKTCMGLGTYMRVHVDLLVPDPKRSISEGCFIEEAAKFNPDNWHGRHMYSLSEHYGFSLDTPFQDLSPVIQELLLYGSKGEKYILKLPPGAKAARDPKMRGAWYRMIGQEIGYGGVAGNIERNYKWYRQRQVANSGMEEWLKKVMVEHTCPDCGGSRLKRSRQRFKIAGKSIFELGEMSFQDLKSFLLTIKPQRNPDAGGQILAEIIARLDLLLGIGLDYLNLNRRSSTLSGGEAQRIRLSTQIGSGLMGMLYVLDEPSIGLHPKDNVRMITTLNRLRDLGNTVIVVEHDEETIRAADYIVEMGPGPGIHGGRVVVQGELHKILKTAASPTAQFLSGKKAIEVPPKRRSTDGKSLKIIGARENNLKNIEVEVPLGNFVCVTGASGSGKSSLIHEILYKALAKHVYDSRIISGDHDEIQGMEYINKLTHIDQSPIGRSSRSNPATYVGFYDDIRKIFAATDVAKARGYKAGRFSFNVKTGRCPECQGEGTIKTQLYFMPDVERLCQSCKGARFNPETLEVTYQGKTIAEVLNMSLEEGETFFQSHKKVHARIKVLNELGLGYLTLGQSSTTLSGGEAQRIKLASELSKMRRGAHVLYILDEPTTGLHLADISRLLDSLNRLVDAGHSVIVIEHHLDVIKTADWIIDLGPEGGEGGGEVLICGTPEEVAACEASYTGRFLRKSLESRAK